MEEKVFYSLIISILFPHICNCLISSVEAHVLVSFCLFVCLLLVDSRGFESFLGSLSSSCFLTFPPLELNTDLQAVHETPCFLQAMTHMGSILSCAATVCRALGAFEVKPWTSYRRSDCLLIQTTFFGFPVLIELASDCPPQRHVLVIGTNVVIKLLSHIMY